MAPGPMQAQREQDGSRPNHKAFDAGAGDWEY